MGFSPCHFPPPYSSTAHILPATRNAKSLTANSLPPLVALVDPELAVPLADASLPTLIAPQVIDLNPFSLSRHRRRPGPRIHSHRMRNRITCHNVLQRRPICRHRRPSFGFAVPVANISWERGGVELAFGCGSGGLVAAGDGVGVGDDRTCGYVCDVAGCEAEGCELRL